LRAVSEATVSAPLDWREVTDKLDPGAFTLKKVVARLAQQKHDPMAELLQTFGGRRSGKKAAHAG
jgi:bifunctional non-homologous end joining protein LigD